MIRRLILVLTLTCVTGQGALKVMTIGDSLTREYEIMALDDLENGTFPSPDSDPGNANTMNWVEILAMARASDVDFGHFSDDTGHEYNYAIPGYDTNMWMDVLDASFPDLEWYLRLRMRQDYGKVDVVVVMVGGNDVNFTYGQLYDPGPGDITPAAFKDNVVANLGAVIDEIRDFNPTVPIVLADVPDPSSSPDIMADHPDAALRANVTVVVNELNQRLADMAATRNLTFAPVSQFTDQLNSADPIFIGGIEMNKNSDPTRENRPLYMFCKEGLHPSTNGQAIMANILIEAINSATGSTIQQLPSRLILGVLMGLDPNQPFIDWAAGKGVTDFSLAMDSDGDGIPNLGEYLLGFHPLEINTSHSPQIQSISGVPMLTLDYTLDADAARLADTIIKQSSDLKTWTTVPAANIHPLPGGAMQVRLPVGLHSQFLRMEFVLRP